MKITVLDDWDYTPAFGGNRKQPEAERTVYTFTLLSGREEMNLRREGKEIFPNSLESIVKRVKNPPVIVDAKGQERKATVDDLGAVAELKGLYLELVVEYGKKATLDGESAKN